MSINGISNNSMAIIPMKTSSTAKNLNEGTFDYQAIARENVITAYLERDNTGFTAEQNEALKTIFSKNVAR